MSSSYDIDQMMRKTQRYWYEDGFQDIGFGAFILALGLVFTGQVLTPAGSPLWLVWGLGSPLLLLSGGLLVARFVRALKERITFPRTGYVAYPLARGKSKWFRMLLVVAVAAAISGMIVVVQKNWLSLTVIFGLVYLAVFLFMGLRFSLRRYLFLALWSFVLGLALAPLALTMDQAGALYHVGTGSAWLLAGWLTWRNYNKSALQQAGSGD